MTKHKENFQSSGRVLKIVPGCIVCKTCEFMAPEVFEVAEKSLSAIVLVAKPDSTQLPGVLEAIRNCPENVIKFQKEK